jgi:hypothetical protein
MEVDELIEYLKGIVASRLCAPGNRPNYVQYDIAHYIVNSILTNIEREGFVLVKKNDDINKDI